MKFGLSDNIIEKIQQVLTTNSKVDKAYIFGSRAKGNYREASDIDMAIKGQNLNYNDVLSLGVKLDEMELPYKIDLLNYHTIKEPALKEHIDRVGIEFYSRWKEYILTDMGTLQRGKSKHRPRYAFHLYGGPYPFIQTGQIREASKYITKYEQTYSEDGLAQSKLWKKGTLCITIAANIAEIAILGMDACFPDSVLGFIPNKKKCDLDFAFYTLKYFQKELQQMGDGSVQDNINLGTFTQIKFPFPPLPEQTAIASILSSLDDKIDLLHRQNKTLEQLAETLFRQWFVEEAEESWETKTISEIIEVRDGTHDSPKQAETGRYLITSKHLKSTGIDFSTAYKISESDFADINKRSKVDKDDILFSMIGTLGLIHYVDKEPDFAIKNMGLFKSSQKPSFARFLYLLLISPDGKRFVYENADGSTQEYITLSSLRNFEFKYPGDIRIEEFNIEIKPIFQKIESNQTQIRTLTQTRDTLLPKLMSGEVRVEIV